jgi:hypothetical protein
MRASLPALICAVAALAQNPPSEKYYLGTLASIVSQPAIPNYEYRIIAGGRCIRVCIANADSCNRENTD